MTFKCKIIELKDNCVVRVRAETLGDNHVEFDVHPNMLVIEKYVSNDILKSQ